MLIVDEERGTATRLRDLLEARAYEVSLAHNATGACRRLDERPCDVALVSLALEQESGVSLIGEVRARYPEALTVVLSSPETTDTVNEALRRGAYDYLRKPINVKDLLTTLERCFDRIRLAAERRELERALRASESDVRSLRRRLADAVGVTRRLQACTELRQVCRLLLEELAAEVDAVGGSIYVVEEEGLSLAFALDPGHAPARLPLPLAEGSVFARALETREPVLMTDIAREPGARRSGWPGYRDGALLVVPIADERGVVCLASLHDKANAPFTEEDRDLALVLAAFAAEKVRAWRTHDQLRRREEEVRLLFSNVSDVVYALDASGTFLDISGSVEEVLGYAPEELIGRSFAELDLLTPESLEQAWNDTLKVFSGEVVITSEYVFQAKDGSLRHGEVSASPVLIDGEVVRLAGIARDVTERRRSAEALRESEERFRLLQEASFGGVLIHADGNIIDVNATLTEMTGYAWEELLERNPLELFEPSCRQSVADRIAREDFGPYEALGQHKDGRTFPLEVRARLLPYQGRTVRVAELRDISERKRAEQELREREETFRALAEHAHDTIMRFDSDLRHLYVNPSVEKLTGIPAVDFIGRTHRELGFPKELIELWDEALRKVFRTGAPNRAEFELPGGRWIDWLLAPEFAEDGQVSAVLTSARDITERRIAEQERESLAEQLRHSQKMEAIGRLAGGVAHDFNNLLTAILGYCEIVLASLGESDPLYADVAEIKAAADRAAALTDQLLAFSRKQIIKPKVVDPNEVVARAQRMLGRIIGEDIELLFSPGHGVSSIRVDPAQLDQVLVNLATNSRDAMPEGGRLTIDTANVELDAGFCRSRPGFMPGEYVRLTVRDSGCGMDDETSSRIFEPFFSTKGKDKGTGLGLATVYGIVKQNEGFIDVDSAPGEGSTFTIYLPRAEAAEVQDLEEEPTSALPRGSETVLLVEDEDIVRSLAKRVLAAHGYTVIEAASGGEALLECEQRLGGIDLLLTDVIMPRMNGRDLLERLRGLAPGLRALFMSGYTESVIAHHGVLEDGTHFLQKPFTIEALVRKVRDVLDRSR